MRDSLSSRRRPKFALAGIAAGLAWGSFPVVAQAPTRDAVALALVDGEAALAAHDPSALMAAALVLATHRAQPQEGKDLARLWAHQAVLWGAKPQPVPVRRGRILGPGYRQLVLAPRAQFRTRQLFAAGQGARVELMALSEGAFSLTIVDPAAGEVCRRNGTMGELACAWVPPFSAPHDITVENSQSRPARFYLVTY